MTLPVPGTYQNLLGHQQLALKAWMGHLLSGEGKQGLWVYGSRGAGSTYVASVALRRATREVGEDWDYVTAQDLVDKIHLSWSSSEVSRNNSGDYDLYVEAARFEDELKALWTIRLLWVDDLYDDTMDMRFWRKFIQERLVARVKQGLPTIVSGNITPNDVSMEGLRSVIETWFVTCYAER